MSNEFIEFKFPCPECLVRSACQKKGRLSETETETKKITEDDLYNAYNSPCLTVPMFDNSSKAYEMMFVECMANMCKRMMNTIGNNERPKGVNAKTGAPMEYIQLFHIMAEVMQYVVNSTSWREGTLKEFDKAEIKVKLKRIKWLWGV